MKECSCIVEFDKMNNTQIDELWKYLLDKNIKFHVLKSNDDFLKEQKYKELIEKVSETLETYKLFCLSRLDKTSGLDIGAYQYKIDKLNYVLDILKEVE